MSRGQLSWVLGLNVVVLALGATAWAGDSVVNTVVDMTPAGRLVPPPSVGHPTFYVPVLGGYLMRGASVAGEPAPPPPTEVAKLVARALATQGYFLFSYDPTKAIPSLVLSIHWGYMNPDMDEGTTPDGDSTGTSVYNQGEEIALLGGNTMHNLDLDFEREAVMQGIEQDRYFIVISAYDLRAYMGKKHHKELLWQAKMSVPSNRVTLGDVLAGMLDAGAPHFGRESTRPTATMITTGPQGHVQIGTPEVKDYQDAGAGSKK